MALVIWLIASPAKAICPVCAIAVGAGVGLSRYFGVDDTITGLWIGALIISMSIWTIEWLTKKKIKFYGQKTITVIAYYLFSVGPLYYNEIIGHPFNKLWGIDKLVLGIFVGSILFLGGVALNGWLKKMNNNKVFFPFQKVIIPVSMLLLGSAIFYFIIN